MPLSKPTTGIADCCARAARGQRSEGAAAAPPRRVMNARRFMQSIPDLILGRRGHAPDERRDNITPPNRGLWVTSRLEIGRNPAQLTTAYRFLTLVSRTRCSAKLLRSGAP